MSPGDVLNAWKANRDAGRLVVAATCPAEPRALTCARELRAPVVAVVDSRALLHLIRRGATVLDSLPCVPLRQRLRRLTARIASSRATARSPLLALWLMALYLRRGNPLCLFSALALLAHFGHAIIRRRVGRRLFDGRA